MFNSPQYSKKHINRAGNVLVAASASPEEREHAFDVLNHWRTCHAYPINTFQSTLRSRLAKVCNTALVAQRLKRTPSIIKKLQLNPGMQLARMQDIGGLRAVVNNISQVRHLENMFKNSRSAHELIREDDYIESPKVSGYRSLHLVYRYLNNLSPQYNGLCLELQIRTKLQHAWATAVETIGTFLDQALKSSEGSDEWLEYFKIVSAAFAITENAPVLAEFSNLSKDEIFGLVNHYTEKLGVRQKLGAFAVAANAVSTGRVSGNYHLVTLNVETKLVTINSFGLASLEEANRAYTEAEQAAESNPSIQAVLVATNSIEALKRAYPNYFLDSRQFVAELGKIQRLVLASLKQINSDDFQSE